jgi:hypothetical protein
MKSAVEYAMKLVSKKPAQAGHGLLRILEVPGKHAENVACILRAVVQTPVIDFGGVALGSPDDRSKIIPAP